MDHCIEGPLIFKDKEAALATIPMNTLLLLCFTVVLLGFT